MARSNRDYMNKNKDLYILTRQIISRYIYIIFKPDNVSHDIYI